MMSKEELVDVYVETESGWELLFEDIPEDIALKVWKAGFQTGENKISIESKKNKEFFKNQMEKLHK